MDSPVATTWTTNKRRRFCASHEPRQTRSRAALPGASPLLALGDDGRPVAVRQLPPAVVEISAADIPESDDDRGELVMDSIEVAIECKDGADSALASPPPLNAPSLSVSSVPEQPSFEKSSAPSPELWAPASWYYERREGTDWSIFNRDFSFSSSTAELASNSTWSAGLSAGRYQSAPPRSEQDPEDYYVPRSPCFDDMTPYATSSSSSSTGSPAWDNPYFQDDSASPLSEDLMSDPTPWLVLMPGDFSPTPDTLSPSSFSSDSFRFYDNEQWQESEFDLAPATEQDEQQHCNQNQDQHRDQGPEVIPSSSHNPLSPSLPTPQSAFSGQFEEATQLPSLLAHGSNESSLFATPLQPRDQFGDYETRPLRSLCDCHDTSSPQLPRNWPEHVGNLESVREVSTRGSRDDHQRLEETAINTRADAVRTGASLDEEAGVGYDGDVDEAEEVGVQRRVSRSVDVLPHQLTWPAIEDKSVCGAARGESRRKSV